MNKETPEVDNIDNNTNIGISSTILQSKSFLSKIFINENIESSPSSSLNNDLNKTHPHSNGNGAIDIGTLNKSNLV